MNESIDHTGESRIMNCGLKATIIKYNNFHNIDVQFEDGIVTYNKEYNKFKKGEIGHPNIKTNTIKNTKDRTGETRIMNCGLKATIIKYHNTSNIDVQFEDGIIVYNKKYDAFNKGKIGHPNIKTKKTDHTNETNITKTGMKITIINYRQYKDIDIQFEDGTIVYNENYKNFKNGNITHPTAKITTNHIGETNIASNGMKITIIAYREYNDIDIQFEDGTIVYHKRYLLFKKGKIGHPNIKITKNRTGETNTALNGMKITIIAYRRCNDIDIQFEDGTIVYNKQYNNFKNGTVKHPNINTHNIQTIAKHINEIRTMSCGQKATITNYRNYDNIDITFENGIIVYNKNYTQFRKGIIKMPKTINSIKLKEFAYKLNNNWYYICSHPTWTEDKILSVKEIYAYQLKQVA